MQRENEFIFYIFDAIREKGEKKGWKKNSLTQSTLRSTWLRVTHARNRADMNICRTKF